MSEKAVAIRYRPDLPAPFVLAKGRGHLADRIREIAESAGVPVREETLSADLLYSIDVGEYIPEDLYELVARLLVFAYRVESKNR